MKIVNNSASFNFAIAVKDREDVVAVFCNESDRDTAMDALALEFQDCGRDYFFPVNFDEEE